MRGLDYYGRTVFEWTTQKLGAQGTICGGGRYDGLVKPLGGRSTLASVCARYGTCCSFDGVLDVVPDMYQIQANIYLMLQQSECESAIRELARTLRTHFPKLRY